MNTDPRSSAVDYRRAGVDIDAGNETVRRIKSIAQGTFTPGVLSDIGSFGGLFRLGRERYLDPVLASSADGVGTKLKIAFATGRHDTVGADLVNHCVNDVLVQGANPLFFLDYLATGRLSPMVAEQVIAGVARGCRENGCALIGGETAEMPGFYADGEYDIAGFIVGVVERSKIVDGRAIQPGDVLIGLPSAGLHTNGYSLARHVLFDVAGLEPDTFVTELEATVGEALLAPHRSYLRSIRPLLGAGLVKGMAHITGGGMTENLPRVLPAGCAAHVDSGAWMVPPIFRFLQNQGNVAADEMFRVFNMGIGLIVACRETDANAVFQILEPIGEHAVLLGHVIRRAPRRIHRDVPHPTCRCTPPRPFPPSPHRRPDLGPRQQSAVDHRPGGLAAPRCDDRDRDLESRPRRGGTVAERAATAGIEAIDLGTREYRDRDAHDRAIVDVLRDRRVDLVCLAGYRRLVGAPLLEAFPGWILNVHPSLLPAFPGLDAQRQALDHGVRVAGSRPSIIVTPELDNGPIVLQAAVPVLDADTVETLSARILIEEHRIYPEAIRSGARRRLVDRRGPAFRPTVRP